MASVLPGLDSNHISYGAAANTSTNSVISSKQIDTSIKKYPAIKNAIGKKIQIPGLYRTNVSGLLSYNMCPQGYCTAGNYLLITAYGTINDSTKKVCKDITVIYVLNKSGKYLATINLNKKGHVGGLTYNPKRKEIVIADSDGGNNYYWVSYANLVKAIKGNKKVTLGVQKIVNKASAITYYDNKLWVATFDQKSNKTEIRSYNASYRSNNSCPVGRKITFKGKKLQGITFISKNRMLVSMSYTRTKNSSLSEYDVKSATATQLKNRTLTLPPMSQNVVYSGGSIYVLFESGASKYRKSATNPIDKVLELKYNKLAWNR